MPYTVKAVVSCLDKTLSNDAQVVKIKTFFTNIGFDITDISKLRQQMIGNGTMLARGSIVAPDGLSITTTTIWSSQEDHTTFISNPISVQYASNMATAGWNLVITPT